MARATSRSSLGLSDTAGSVVLQKAKRPGDSPSRPFLPEESDPYFLFEVFRFAFRAAGLFFAVVFFFFGAISASLRGECSSLGPSEWDQW
jgi:hypothetical protein